MVDFGDLMRMILSMVDIYTSAVSPVVVLLDNGVKPTFTRR